MVVLKEVREIGAEDGVVGERTAGWRRNGVGLSRRDAVRASFTWSSKATSKSSSISFSFQFSPFPFGAKAK
ncbi:UNVERIFIED_CONTAM: hypothetical protein Sangu_0324500 [Sesamum angustifolium]|uniref:Uncharacterized protein n=1 Tax=Sesamum angustifolium TaxID=2727405 RepID=A0AAW2QQB6_9LAMI